MTIAYGLCVAMDGVELPDPYTCTHEEWERYVQRVDVFAMDHVQAAAHREAFEAYRRRVEREQRETRERSTRLLDARDQANVDADALSERHRRLQGEVLEKWDAVLALHAEHGPDDERVVEARRAHDRLSEQLDALTRELIEANQRAVQAFRDAR